MPPLALDHVQIAIPAGGEDQARSFFGELLGLPEIAKPAELEGRGGCWFQLGDRQLHLGVDPQFRPARKAHIALAADDLSALQARLADAGYDIRTDAAIEGGARFFTDDPFGNRIEFLESKN